MRSLALSVVARRPVLVQQPHAHMRKPPAPDKRLLLPLVVPLRRQLLRAVLRALPLHLQGHLVAFRADMRHLLHLIAHLPLQQHSVMLPQVPVGLQALPCRLATLPPACRAEPRRMQ